MRRGEREWKSGGRRAGRLPSSGGEDVPCLSQGKWFQFRSIKLTRRVVLRSSFLPSFLPRLSPPPSFSSAKLNLLRIGLVGEEHRRIFKSSTRKGGMFRPPSFLLLLLLPPSVQPCDGNFEFSFQSEGRRERIYPSIHAPRGDNRGRDEGETRERRGSEARP